MSDESSDDKVLRARKNLQAIFTRLHSVGQNTVAQGISASEAFVSGWKTKDAETAAKILAELGLKVVPVGLKCFSPAKITAILQLAKDHLAGIEKADELAWDE